MIETLINLKYKRVCEFNNKDMRENLNFFIKKRCHPVDAEYYAKIIEQHAIYEMDNGDEFTNIISLNIFFLIDEKNDEMLDCFCVASYPFEIKTETDIKILNNLYDIYINDLKQLMEVENEEIRYMA